MTQPSDAPPPWKRTAQAAVLIAFASLVVTVVSLGTAVRANDAADKAQTAADKAQEAIDLVIEQRTDARKRACDADNKVLEGQRLQAAKSAQAFSAFAMQLIGDRPIEGEIAVRLTAFNVAVVDPFLALADPEADGPFKPRDCSPLGIEAFYAAQGDKP